MTELILVGRAVPGEPEWKGWRQMRGRDVVRAWKAGVAGGRVWCVVRQGRFGGGKDGSAGTPRPTTLRASSCRERGHGGVGLVGGASRPRRAGAEGMRLEERQGMSKGKAAGRWGLEGGRERLAVALQLGGDAQPRRLAGDGSPHRTARRGRSSNTARRGRLAPPRGRSEPIAMREALA